MPKPKTKKSLEIAAIEALSKADFDFCFYRALNKSDVEAFQLAYGGTKSAAQSNAWRKASNTEIVAATNHLRKQMAGGRVESAILTKEEILGFCARAIRTPLAELDEHDPLVIEVTKEVSPMGSVKKKYKKANPLDAAKVALNIIGDGDNSAPKPIGTILLSIIDQGIPEERDVTPINDQ